MKKLLTLGICLAIANAASAQILSEDFDGGAWPPAGWTVIDNSTAGDAWNTATYYNRANTVGTGECACIDSDEIGFVDVDTELWTPPFDLPVNPQALVMNHHFNQYISSVADIDVSTDGGVTWTNIANLTTDVGPDSDDFDLAAFANTAGVIVRFHYWQANWEWYWLIDDLAVQPPPPPICSIWEEDFDSGTWPPAGWTVIDNATAGQVWQIESYFGYGNSCPGGSGESASINADSYGSTGARDSELVTSPINLPNGPCKLMWSMDYQNYAYIDFADVDISTDGGTTWANLVSYNADLTGFFEVDLSSYAGTSGALLRFHYYDFGNWGWWWQIDDLKLVGLATVTPRNAGSNPNVYTVSGPPVTNATFQANIDAGSTGLPFAQLFGYAGSLTYTLSGGQTVLVDFTSSLGELLALPILAGPIATYDLTVPPACSLVGLGVSTQAAAFGSGGVFVLTNAQDMVVGY